MAEFDRIFADDLDAGLDFDTIFGSQEDGDLIDKVCGFREDGSCETDDFDELHQTDDDATPEDIDDELGTGNDTKNAPSGAEGTDKDPNIDLAFGEDYDEFSANGKKGETDADKMYSHYDQEEMSAKTGEGPDVNMDPESIDDEFDKICKEADEDDFSDDMDWNEDESSNEGGDCDDDESVEEFMSFMEGDATDDIGAGCDPGDSSYDDDEFADLVNNVSGSGDYEDDGLTDGNLGECGECGCGSENGTDDLDSYMDKIDDGEPGGAEGTHDDAYDDGEYDGSEGDSDLIDMVAGND